MEDVQWWTVRVPSRLIADAELPVGTKALYMVLLDAREPGTWECAIPRLELAARAGFRSAGTLDAHLRRLVAAGWIEEPPRRRPVPVRLRPLRGEATTAIPGMLATHAGLTPAAKCLYALLVSRRDARSGRYQGRQPDLLVQPGLHSTHALQTAVTQLQRTGWLALRSQSGAGGRKYEPLDPHLSLRQTVLDRLYSQLEHKPSFGEALMQAMLTECIADEVFQDNARLSRIKNPLTGEPLEFDRLYGDAKVAIEFNGPQHYTTTEMFPDPNQVFSQQARDLMKEAQARREKITLVTILPPDLSFERLVGKLRDLLPIRLLRREDPVVRELERLSRAYRRTASRDSRRESKTKTPST